MSNPKKVVFAGGSGFIGTALVGEFGAHGYECVVLSRSARPVPGARAVAWDAKNPGDWVGELAGATAVVNLVGEPIAQRWTEDAKRRMIDSRLDSSHAIANAIGACAEPPAVWVNASGVGYYGHTGDRALSEATGPGDDFPARMALQWEQACLDAPTPATRKAVVRIGFVLGRGGGAMPPLVSLAKVFLGGAIGDGKQFVSWIHIADLARLFRFAVESDVMGAINGTAPKPVTQAELMARIRQHLGRPPVPPVPAPLFSAAARLLGIEPDLVLRGQRAMPVMPLFHGFEYRYATLDVALTDLLGS